jgi:hypothetical protein
MAMVTADAAANTAAAEKHTDAEKKPSYVSYNGAPRGVVESVVARQRREDMLDKSPLALHAAAAVFAFVALVLVATNQHGDWMQFDRYQEYKCVGECSGSTPSSIPVHLRAHPGFSVVR